MKLLLLLTLLFAPAATAAQNAATAEPDTDHAYLMPCEKGAQATVRRLSAVETRRAHQMNLLNFTSWEFAFKHSTAVYAAREGTVVETDTDHNRITVEHSDGSLARYFALDDIAVAAGDRVSCATMLGQTSQAAYNTWVVGFELLCLRPNTNTDPRSSVAAGYDFMEEYIDPMFRTSRGTAHLVEGRTYKSVRHKNWLGIWH